MEANDRQEGGAHYMLDEFGNDRPIQPWDVCAMFNLDFFEGNVVKYILRKDKEHENPVERLKKARHYLDKKIEVLEAAGKHSTTFISQAEHNRRTANDNLDSPVRGGDPSQDTG